MMLLVPFLLLSIFTSLTTRKQLVLFCCAALVVIGCVAFSFTEAADLLLWRWNAPPMPSEESRFVSVAASIREQAAEAENIRRLEALRADLCRASPDAATDWTGKVLQVFDTPSGRRKVVVIGLSPFLELRTSFFEDASDTLLKDGTELSRLASALSPGDPVLFSGRFVADAAACDTAQNAANALGDPNFLFRFSAIRRYDKR